MHAHRTIAVLTALLLTTLLAVPGFADPIDRRQASDQAARWTAAAVGEDGLVVSAWTGEPDVSSTIDAALGLAAAERGSAAFARAVAAVEAGYEDYVTDDEGEDMPGRLAKVVLLADAAGADPRDFGGEDLIARIEATRHTDGVDEGMYGPVNMFGSVTTSAYAVLALVAAGVDVPQPAVDWLADQQCATGAWVGYRDPAARLVNLCNPDAQDTNNTALAVQALVAAGADMAHDPTEFLAAARNDDGGWAYTPGDDTDTNSTALVIQALTALDEDLGAAPWTDERRDSPFTALAALQLKCEAEPADRGAFAYQPEDDGSLAANDFATFQALWGTATAAFPLGERTLSAGAGAPACPALQVERLEGDNRIATAARIANRAFPQGSGTVVLANGYGYADALAGVPLAAQQNAPILLTAGERLSPAAAGAIRQLGAERVILLGGPAALSTRVADETAAMPGVRTTERIEGANRYATAAQIAQRLPQGVPAYVAQGHSPDAGRGWPDALAAGALAAHEGRPVLLVTSDRLPEETRAALRGRDEVTIVGGEAAVSAAVAAEIDAEAGDVARVAGENRYGTALAVSRLARDVGMDAAHTWVATGLDFADALAAGPAVARAGGVLMLVDARGLDRSPATRTYLREVGFDVTTLTVVGGPNAVPTAVVDAIRDDLR
jgi:putative cell wall-binding protein